MVRIPGILVMLLEDLLVLVAELLGVRFVLCGLSEEHYFRHVEYEVLDFDNS